MGHTLLIALAIVLAIAAIVAALIRTTRKQARKRKEAMWASYKSVLVKHDLSPTVMEEYQHRIIGLDTARNVLVFVEQEDGNTAELVELRDVADCKIRRSGHTVSSTLKNGKDKIEEYINAIYLSFDMRNGNAVNVPVYREVLDGAETKLLLQEAAEKWQDRIRSSIHNR